MVAKLFKLLIYTFLIGATILFALISIPKKYNTPTLQKRDTTKYWDLPSGSKIGYTHISAKGNKKPYPIIYLHGGPGGPIYDNNIKILTPLSDDGFDVYLYDQIGCGHSDRLVNIEEYTADRHKRDLVEIINIIGAEKVILIGQSWGAMLATLFISDYPEKIEKMIFTGPGPILPIRRELANLKAPDSLRLTAPHFSNRHGNEKANNIRSEAMLKWAYIFGNKLAPDKEADDFMTYLNSELNKSTICDTSIILDTQGGAGYYAHIMTLKSFMNVKDQRYKIKNFPAPILIMKGQCDNQKWGYTNEYLELFPNHELFVVPNAGHALAAEQPELYLKTVRGFLNN